jgi:hypothetical protein
MTTAKGHRDLGKDLNQVKVDDVVEHWKIEGYDVYPFASWEGTHTSCGANIERDGTHIIQVRNLSAARTWIRQQAGKASITYDEAMGCLTGVFGLPDLTARNVLSVALAGQSAWFGGSQSPYRLVHDRQAGWESGYRLQADATSSSRARPGRPGPAEGGG